MLADSASVATLGTAYLAIVTSLVQWQCTNLTNNYSGIMPSNIFI